ncbi:MAG: TonB-dependent receptor [Pseudomonadota bacterium]
MAKSLITTTAILSVLAGVASAQEIREELVITAQKREQALSDVPIAVSAYTADDLNEARVDDLTDLQLISPNLTVRAEQRPTATSFIIRGLGTTSVGNFEQSVGVYIDGVFRGRPGAALQDLIDIDRVEVLRGPQSTIFGRNNSAGAVNITTAKPSYEYGGSFDATYGSDNEVRVRGSLTGPLIEDRIAFRISASHNQNDGRIDNALGPDANATNRETFRGQLLFDLTDATSLRLIGDYSEAEDRCCIGPLVFAADADLGPGVPGMAPPGGLFGGTLPNNGVGTLTTINGVSGTQFDPFDREIATTDDFGEDSENAGVSAELNHDFGVVNLTTIASYRHFKSDPDTLFEPVDALSNLLTSPAREIDELSVEVRLANSEPGLIDWLTGVYYFDQDIEEDREVSGDFFGGVFFANEADFDATSIAVFGQATVNVTDRFDITGGLRYLSEDISADITSSGAFALPGGAGNGSNSADNDAFMGSGSIGYEVADFGNIYARYARGYKSGGVDLAPFFVTVADLDFEPETVDSYEIGGKLNFWDRRLTLNTAVFYQEAQDLQVQAFNGVAFSTLNAARVETYGVEIEYTLTPTDRILLSGGVTFLDAEYGSFENAPGRFAEDGTVQDLTGETPLLSPDWTITGSAQYTHPLDAIGWEVKGRMDYRFTSEHTTDLQNNDLFANDATFVLNLSLQLYQPESGFGLQLFGRNVTNEGVIVSGNETPFTNSGYAFVNDPATWGVTASYQF